jgi:dipeptidyl aminopeptidase/acylaminoacyl peptidase
VISADGKSIAFQVTSTDWENNRFDQEIWLVRKGEEPFQLTRSSKGSSTSPRWAPDGKWIAFLADRGNKTQIHLIRPDGGEAQVITEVAEGIRAFGWSPDGHRIAFMASEKEEKDKKEREKQYGEFAIEDDEYQLSHLWIVEVKPDLWPSPREVPCRKAKEEESEEREDSTESTQDCVSLPKPKRVTSGSDFTVTNFEWSPDGSWIAFDHRKDPLINSRVTADISILEVETGQIRPLVTDPGYDGGPVWSPDSKWLIYSSAGGNTTSDYYRNRHLYKISVETVTSTRLASDLDEQPSAASWTPEGIFLLAWQKTRRHLFRVDPQSGETSLFAATPENIWSMDFSKDGRTVALSGRSPNTMDEIFLSELSPLQPEPVTNMTRQIEGLEIGTSELISWNSSDGVIIEGVLHKPRNFDPGRKYPLFVIIHGGPTGIDVPGPALRYVYPIQQWLAKGALVLKPNYRGSAGYGEQFRSLNVRNLGVGDAWDVLSGVDHLVEMGIADPERMGAMGWSQGGYISAFLTTNTDRFKAISVGAGISNWVTYYVNTDIHPFTRQYLEADPWDDPEIYAKTSPMTTIKNAKTPTLIQHGEFDKRVPIPNAYELYQGLQDQGVETKLIVYKGFGHGINKPKERLAAIWHNWQWFAKYIWGEDVEIPLEQISESDEGANQDQ